MNRRIIIKLGIVVFIIITFRVIAIAGNSKRNNYTYEERKMYELGKMQANDGVVCLDDENDINKSDIEKKAQMLSDIFGYDKIEVEQNITERVVNEQAIYLEALDADVELSNEEYEDLIGEIKESLYSSEEYDAFKAYLSGYGISEEEYWIMTEDTYRKGFIISKYIDEYYVKDTLKTLYDEGETGVKCIGGNYYIGVENQQLIENKINERIDEEIDMLVKEFKIKVH